MLLPTPHFHVDKAEHLLAFINVDSNQYKVIITHYKNQVFF